jgi:3-hydroxyisobutyrate dehydrogenase-like beta-hydroxyacid dehydrogenase
MASKSIVGFIGLGHMGSKMVNNFSKAGKVLQVFDRDRTIAERSIQENISYSSLEDISTSCDLVFSMLPNDLAVEEISQTFLNNNKNGVKKLHVSCSTISPNTSRKLASHYASLGHTFIAAPVFARPDGLAKKQATWLVSGEEQGDL